MKGRILFVDGREEFIEPKNGTDFSLEELRAIVGGYIEIVYLDDSRIMIVNEEGKIYRLPVNVKATFIVNGIGKQDLIVGNVLVCRSEMVK